MGQRKPEFSPREAELFQERLTWSTESEGILDRVGIPAAEFIERSGSLIESIRRGPPGRVELDPDSLPRWHHYIFQRTKLPIVGRFRTANDPPVGFGTPIVNAGTNQLGTIGVQVSLPEEISARLSAAFERFNHAVGGAPQIPEAAARAVAELQTDVITTHPFVDGNSRTTNVLTQAALHRLGQPEFLMLPHDWELAIARSDAVRPDEAAINRTTYRAHRQANHGSSRRYAGGKRGWRSLIRSRISGFKYRPPRAAGSSVIRGTVAV